MAQYATETEAQAYIDDRLNVEAWTDATSANRDKALIMATRAIDRLNFRGDKAGGDNQVLQFPRGDDTLIPQDIKDASAEIALSLLDGIDPELEFENLSMITQGYANVRATYDRSRPAEHIIAGIPSVVAWRFIKPYLRDPLTLELSRIS